MLESKEGADEYDAWFRAKVEEAKADQRPTAPYEKLMREIRELILRK